MRVCYNCKLELPLFLFRDSKSPVKWCQNKAYVCKICNFIAAKDRVVRKQDGRFVVVKLTLKERIKELW